MKEKVNFGKMKGVLLLFNIGGSKHIDYIILGGDTIRKYKLAENNLNRFIIYGATFSRYEDIKGV